MNRPEFVCVSRVGAALGIDDDENPAMLTLRLAASEAADMASRDTIPVTRKTHDMPMQHEWTEWPKDKFMASMLVTMRWSTLELKVAVEIEKIYQTLPGPDGPSKIALALHTWAVQRMIR